MAASTTRTVKAKFDGDAKGMIAAAAEGEAAIDRFGKNTEKKFNKSGEKAAKGFGNSIRKWFGGAGGLKEIGDSGGTVFGSGFLGALKTPVLGPAIAAVLTAAVVTALPAVGAVAASGMVAGFGAGLVGLGLVFAAKSEQVKKKWHDTLTVMGTDMRTFSKPFEGTLIKSAEFAERTWGKFRGTIQATFKELAPAATVFSDQLFRGLEKLQPVVRPLSDAFQAVLRSLGPAFQSAIRNVSNGLIRLSESVKKNPDGLADTVEGVGQLTDKALGLVVALNNVNGAFERMTGGTSAVDVLFGKANSKIGSAIQTVQRGINPFTGLKDVMGLLGGETEKTTDAVADQQATLGLWTQGLTASQAASMTAAGGQKTLGGEAESTATKFTRQKAATDALISSMFRLQGLSLGLSQSQIAYQAAVDGATASVKANGRTLDINTEKGRANRSALNEVAAAANQQTQAMIESGKGTAAAGRAAEVSRSNFSRIAQQMGLSKKEADKLAASLIAIPPKKNSTVAVTGAKGAKSDVDALTKSLNNIPRYTTANIYRNLIETHTVKPVGVLAPGRASGGNMQAGRTYLLGERGPEPVVMGQNGGARAISSESAPRELLTGNSQPIIVENHIEIGGEVVKVVRTEIRADKRQTKRGAGAK